MKLKAVLGIALICLGLASFGYATISYTRREKVLQVGSLIATADKKETIPLPPVVGFIGLAAGIAVLTL